MCLLVSHSASSNFDDAFLHGVYTRNSDGIGVMFANEFGLNILRCVPENEKDFIDFFKKNIEGRDCVWHARMRTHGDIDLTNCHPYQIISGEEGYPLYLAHNGVLSMGNSADTTKSDTWHYIQNYLRPMLLNNPEFFKTKAFKDMVASHIGHNNKVIIMDAYGDSVIINESAGVRHEGSWLSNTYAWDTSGTAFDRQRSYTYVPYFKGYSGLYDDDDDDDISLLKQGLSDEEEMAMISDDMIDFACCLFDVARDATIDLDEVAWSTAEIYYTKVGSEQAWDLIECIQLGAYTQDELLKELEQYGVGDNDGFLPINSSQPETVTLNESM